MGPALVVYDHLSASPSGNASVLHEGQPDVPTVDVTKRALTVEENSDTVLAETAIRGAGEHVPAIASEDFSDVPSPTATMTGSGALPVKNAVVHISLSTLQTRVTGK